MLLMANSKALLRVRLVAAPARLLCSFLPPSSPGPKFTPRRYSVRCSLEPPDVPRLAETARISLTPKEVEDFAPKIRQVIDWCGKPIPKPSECRSPSKKIQITNERNLSLIQI